MRRLDLNCDVGEERGDDLAVLPHVTSVNIACGLHAGGPSVMRATVEAAAAAVVAVGAHPGYPDREGFGRRHPGGPPDPAAVFDLCLYQIAALAAFAGQGGVRLQHVKPHGALYHDGASRADLAEAIVRAVRVCRADLILVGPPGSELGAAAARAGLRYAPEIFADRAYRSDGQLVPRSEPGAMVEGDDATVAARAVAMVIHGRAPTIDGGSVARIGHTLCLHGDEPGAPGRARAIRAALQAAGVELAPLGAWL